MLNIKENSNSLSLDLTMLRFVQISAVIIFLSSCSSVRDLEPNDILVIKNPHDSDGIYELSLKGEELKSIDKDASSYILDTKPTISTEYFERITISEFQNYKPNEFVGIYIVFSDVGTELFADLTYKQKGNEIYFVLGQTVLSSPRINDQITSGECMFYIPKNKFSQYFKQY